MLWMSPTMPRKTSKVTSSSVATSSKATAAPSKKALIVVESPSKAKTIQKYLGRDFTVKASVGHIKDLPKSKLGVDIDHGFKPEYQVITGKNKVIDEIKNAASNVSEIYLAPDPDREGEAIAWHIAQELPKKGKKIHRVLFNSITKPAILEALKKPVELDEKKFQSQQARRILDRLVGYKISPILWDKVRRGLSAGRVQSVAVKMIVDREKEIQNFKPEEYWSLDFEFQKKQKPFIAFLAKINGENPKLNSQAEVDHLIESLKSKLFTVTSLETKDRLRRPSAPFITSKLQQDAANRFGFSAKKTMTLAQKLYEGIDLGNHGTHGLITYMRTDSVRITPEVLPIVRQYIQTHFGAAYLPSEPNFYKTKKSAQDAHEAIRPTSLDFPPELVEPYLDRDEFRLYQLIWQRFIACQMNPAIYDQTTMELETISQDSKKILARVTGSKLKFPGYTAAYQEEESTTASSSDASSAKPEQTLPDLKEGEQYAVEKFLPEQHFTQPPPRFSDATLIKDLEEKGIGRPSTYAAILSNIQDREYVEKRENRYYPSELGIVVTDLLIQAFPDIINETFTADMEEKLDSIEEGDTDWVKMMKEFWKPFSKTLENAKAQMKDIKRLEIPTDYKCDKCGSVMVIKWGKLGQFLACSNYPDCKHTEEFTKDEKGKIQILPREKSDKICPKCQSSLLIKHGKFGKFLACERYPDCKHTEVITTGIACPSCKEGELAQRMSRYKRFFYGCNRYPQCSYAIWDKPIAKECPECKFPILTEKTTKREGFMHKCPNKECNYKEILEDPATAATLASTEKKSVA